jgi:hypothetical protein
VSFDELGSGVAAVVVGVGTGAGAVVVTGVVDVVGGTTVTVRDGLVGVGGGAVVVTSTVVAAASVVAGAVGLSIVGCVRVTVAPVRVVSALPAPPPPHAPSRKPATPARKSAPATRTIEGC